MNSTQNQIQPPVIFPLPHRVTNSPILEKPNFKRKGEQQLLTTRPVITFFSGALLSPSDSLHKDLEVLKTLYSPEGAPTQIDLLFHKPSNEHLILKRVYKNRLLCDDHWNSASRELKIHSSINHPSIVNNVGVAETLTEYLALFEYVPRPNYFVDRLEINNNPFMTKIDGGIMKLKSFSYDILQGLKYLHSKRIIHMDIKPANLLLGGKEGDDEYPLVKICDFGLSREADEDGTAVIRARCGTEPYIAPEVQNGRRVTYAADIWSFGVFLYILTVGYSPITLKWKLGSKLALYPRHWKKYEGTGLIDLIEKCLILEPAQRISAAEALQHEWLNI